VIALPSYILDVGGPRIIMQMPKACLLIILSLWIQFDDVVLTAFPRLQHAPLAADDDQYLSVERGQGLKYPLSRQKAGLVSLKPKTADFLPLCTAKGAPLGSNFADPIGSAPLYVFMSLQL
jgi:hypothetical protein